MKQRPCNYHLRQKLGCSLPLRGPLGALVHHTPSSPMNVAMSLTSTATSSLIVFAVLPVGLASQSNTI